MSNNKFFEIGVGFVILFLVVGWLCYAHNNMQSAKYEGYTLSAKFDNVTGLQRGSDVNISGVKVGEVVEISIDPSTYLAIVKFTVDEKVKLPKDTSVSVATNGFFGSKHLSLSPGGDDEYLENDEEVENTQGAINLESLIGKFLFSDKKSN